MEAAVDQPDAPHAAALSMAVFEATSAGELSHEGRQQQCVVVLGGDLDGLVVLVLAHLNVAAHVDHRVGPAGGSGAIHYGNYEAG